MRSVLLLLGLFVCGDPLGSQTQGVIAGRPRLFYESLGHGGQTIVIVHGGPGLSHEYLRPEWDKLAANGRVIYYDQNGCGRSDRVAPFGWRSHVEDLDRVIRTLAPNGRVVLAGSSWGSMLALYYAYEHPDHVKALVLSGVPIGMVGSRPRLPAAANSADRAQQQSVAPWQDHLPVGRLDSVNRGLTVAQRGTRPGLDPRLAKRVKEDCADVAAIINMSLPDAPRGLMLRSIKAPALVIHGSNSGQMSGDGGPGVSAILPNAELVTITNAGHDPWLDQPKAFFAAARRFLAGLSAKA